jgi:hypothetical protein
MAGEPVAIGDKAGFKVMRNKLVVIVDEAGFDLSRDAVPVSISAGRNSSGIPACRKLRSQMARARGSILLVGDDMMIFLSKIPAVTDLARGDYILPGIRLSRPLSRPFLLCQAPAHEQQRHRLGY